APPQFLRQLVAPLVAVLSIFRLIGGLGLLQQRLHFFLQLLLFLDHPAVAHGLVFAGVGLQLRPVQRYLAQLDRPAFQRHRQTCSNMFFSDSRWILRKSEMVRKSGSFPAASTLNGMSSCIRF